MTDKESPREVTVNVNLPTHAAEPPRQVAELKSTGFAYLIWAFAGGLGPTASTWAVRMASRC